LAGSIPAASTMILYISFNKIAVYQKSLTGKLLAKAMAGAQLRAGYEERRENA
jgi:hypothetical protein